MFHSRIGTILFVVMLLLVSCIEDFNPELDQQDVNLYVIEGRVTNLDTLQSIKITYSSEIYNPKVVPVYGCQVTLHHGDGTAYLHSSDSAGIYLVDLPQEKLTAGNTYRLEVITPDGDILQSSWDTLRDCPPMQPVYYLVEEFPTETPGEYREGIQFYVDYDGEGSPSTEIKYEIEETWEYHMDYPIEYTWDGWRLRNFDPPIYDYMVCWRTTTSPQYYTLSTKLFETNRYDQFPIHHIGNNSSKLFIGYSLLVRQLAMGDSAILYFNKLGSNILENGGLYQTQPQQVNGNMVNLSNPEDRVLGYFYAAMGREQRIFMDEVPEMELDFFTFCYPIQLEMPLWRLRNVAGVIYLRYDPGPYILADECVDCRSLGGVTTKPEFGPKCN